MTTLKKDPAPGTTPVDGSTIATDQWNNAVDRLGGESAPTASKAVATDASGNLTTSSTTDTELGYVHGVTSAIQTQINTKTTSGSIVNADVNAAAAIAYSKLNLAGSIVNADVNVAAAIAYAKLALAGSIVNADVNASAAIAYSKLNLAGGIVNADINASAAIAYSKLNLGTSIVNADINASAAIAYAKLALTGSIVNADVNASAAIAYSKLNLTTSIVDGDVSASAAIAKSKISTSSTWAIGDIPTGSSSSTVCIGNDSRLSDSRTPTAHNILSSAHGDTLAGSVARGDIIYGNSTPAWARLAKGTANQVLHSDGTDTAWATLVAADIPNLAASKITSGQLAAAQGGTARDMSADSGLVKVASGTFSAVTAPSGTVVGNSDSQTLTNKTIDSLSNTLQHIYQWPETAKWGNITPNGVGTALFGMIATSTLSGTNTNGHDTNGHFTRQASAASTGSIGGVRSGTTANMFRRSEQCYIKMKIAISATASTRLYCGFIASTALVANNDDPLNALEGFMFGKLVASTNWQIVANDNSGASVATDTGVAVDTSVHTVELYSDSGDTGFYWSLDGSAASLITSNVPASATNLGMQLSVITNENVAKNLDIWWVITTNKK